MDEAGLPPEEALQMVQNASESALEALVGVGEVGLSVASGLAGVVAGLPGSTGEVLAGRGTEEQREKYPGLAPTPEDTLLPTVGEMAEKWTYQPRTETGQQYAENVGKVMAPVDKFLKDFSGFIPGIVEKVPGDSRLGSGILNAADQAIYTALNVMSPTRGVGTAAMLGAKGLQAAGKAASHLPGTKRMGVQEGLRNVDLVTPTAQAIEKAPVVQRFNQVNNAMGQLITRKQLAGLQPGMVQQLHAWKPATYQEGSTGWYGKGEKLQWKGEDIVIPIIDKKIPKTFPKFGHLKSMADTAGWNVLRKMTDNQDAWLRSHYGITANVYQELERLGRVIDRADQQAIQMKGKKGGSYNAYKDEMGNEVIGETSGKPISIKRMKEDAKNQYHAQIAYNRSVLEKYKPGDARIERLAGGELDRYLTPKHRQTSINTLKSDPSIIKDLLGRNIDDDVVRSHIASKISSDLRLKGSNVHISTKPFFFDSAANALARPKTSTGLPRPSLLGRTIVKDGRWFKISNKTHAPYAHGLAKFIEQSKGRPITKQSVIDHFKELNKHIPESKNRYDINYIKRSVVDDGDWISISQWALTDDTLLATIPIRIIINKKNPNMGYYIMYDQMKQGSGIPIFENILDAGSDTNRIYIDIQPIQTEFTDWSGYAPRVHSTTPLGAGTKKDPVGWRQMAEKVREQKFDVPPTEEFLRQRRLRRYAPVPIWASKRGSTAGLLAQDENV